MLEEPEYEDIVRWGRDGDSFVVLEVREDSSPLQKPRQLRLLRWLVVVPGLPKLTITAGREILYMRSSKTL